MEVKAGGDRVRVRPITEEFIERNRNSVLSKVRACKLNGTNASQNEFFTSQVARF